MYSQKRIQSALAVTMGRAAGILAGNMFKLSPILTLSLAPLI